MPKRHSHRAARIVEFCSCGATREDGGDWVERDEGKNAAARELSLRRAPEVREATAAKARAARWARMTAEERAAAMTAMAKLPRPSRRIADRCDCGKYSRALAEKRGHVCK
jgi:acyl-CoA reductase-like NAD-dependent aldehyde dehydrogenase